VHTSLDRSSWERARQDARSTCKTTRFHIALAFSLALAAALFGFAGPESLSIEGRLLRTAGGAALGLAVTYGAAILWSLFWAPYRQRDEARAALEARRKPLPLPNRRGLTEAIAAAEAAAVHYTERWQHVWNHRSDSSVAVKDELVRFFDLHRGYQTACESVEMQRLVAGADYEITVQQFLVGLRGRVLEQLGAATPDPFAFKLEINTLARQAVRDLDEINLRAVEGTRLQRMSGQSD